MATSRAHRLLQHLRQAVAVSDGAGLSDGQLLNRYVSTRDEAAFAALVRRHGPMVLGVCRRLLRNQHDADDAFQATFLVLVKKAASVVPAEMLPNWLHGVARQTAMRARSAAVKRRSRERQVTEMPEPRAAQTDPRDDLRPLLDSELASLPSRYRIAIVLCDLEGMTFQGAANRLGWPLGTLASRHSRGRRMLKERLARRGWAPAGGAAAAWFGGGPASVPPSLASSTVQAGSLYWAGPAVAGGAVSLTVAALTEGVLKAMSLNKIKSLAAVLLMVSMVALGGGLLARNPAADKPSVQQDSQPGPVAAVQGGKKAVAADKPKERKDRLEVRADGKVVRVCAVFGDEAVHAVADRMSYTEGGLLALEGNVKMQTQRGREVKTIEADKVVIDRRAGKVTVQGAGGIRIAVPTLGPVPVAVDFGFPVTKGPHNRGAGQEERLSLVPFLNARTIEEKLDPHLTALQGVWVKARVSQEDESVDGRLLLHVEGNSADLLMLGNDGGSKSTVSLPLRVGEMKGIKFIQLSLLGRTETIAYSLDGVKLVLAAGRTLFGNDRCVGLRGEWVRVKPKRLEGKPADADIPSLKKELDELREKVKKLEKRLSDAGQR